MPNNIRVYELARELGMTNAETLDLAESLGIGVKSHSSSIVDAQADRVRRKAEREGLVRDEQPEEPKPAKKAAKKSTKKAAKKATKKATKKAMKTKTKTSKRAWLSSKPSPSSYLRSRCTWERRSRRTLCRTSTL